MAQDASGRFIVDPSAYDPNGTVAKWLELAGRHPEANVSTLTASNECTAISQGPAVGLMVKRARGGMG